MKLATFLPPGSSQPVAGEVRGEEVVAFTSGTVLDRLASGDRTPADGDAYALSDIELLAPVPQPRVIFGIGLNYAKHAAESGAELPEVPMVFLKLPSSSAPPAGPVRCPEVVQRLDYEVELCLVMGAENEIAGYAVGDDVSARDLQKREPRWVRAKGFDTSAPWGPWITTADEVADAQALRLTSHVNGELRQDSTTADLIFGPRELIDFIAQTCTLAPGDVIMTGTPEGVGQSMDPPQFLQSGDVIRCEVEGLGVIEHRVVVMRVAGADGVELAVETAGEGEAVLLVHGFPDSSRVWRNQLRPLVESGRRVIVPDLRGMGNSDRPQDVDAYRMRTLVADMVAVLDALDVERAHVVGHDWGAGVAWVLAAALPDRVASLAALSVGHPMASRPATLETRQKAWYQLYFLFPEAEELLLRDDAALLREWLADPADGDQYIADLTRPGALTAGLNYYRANVGPPRELRHGDLPPVAAPTLGLWSDGDRYLAERAMQRSGEWVTGPWRYKRVDGASHWLQLDQPETVTGLLLEHLDAAG